MSEAMTLDDIVLSRIEGAANSTSALSEAILAEQRLTGSILRRVAQTLPRNVVAGTIEVNATNLSKLYSRKHLSRVQSEDISDLTALWAEMNEVFMNDASTLQDWIHSHQPALSGRAPVELMETLSGRKALREILNRIRYGDYS